jgi:hypothetical protein
MTTFTIDMPDADYARVVAALGGDDPAAVAAGALLGLTVTAERNEARSAALAAIVEPAPFASDIAEWTAERTEVANQMSGMDADDPQMAALSARFDELNALISAA